MPTTTEVFTRKVPVLGSFIVAAIWFAGMGVAAIAVRPDAVVGFGSPARMMAAVAGSEGSLLDAGRFYITARTGSSTVNSLYAAGAWFVWPVIGRGCGRAGNDAAIEDGLAARFSHDTSRGRIARLTL
jgi:hypothetical protein